MIRSIIRRQLGAQERKLGASLDYLREVLRVSLRAFLKFGLFVPLSEHRRALAPEAAAVARIVAARAEDCGTCVQIAVNQSRASGVAAAVVRAVLERRPAYLAAPLGDVYAFAALVARADAPECAAAGDEPALRGRLRAELGDEAFVELALAIASVRVFPSVKRALGYALSCSKVEIRVA
jgi:alkylhydroperoxidase family enzyme